MRSQRGTVSRSLESPESLGNSSHHGVQEHCVPHTEDNFGLVQHTLYLLADGSGGLVWVANTDQRRTQREEVFGEEQQNLGVPVLLTVSRSDPAHDHLHRLARQPLVLLRELQDLVGLHLLRLPHINVENHGGEEQAVAGVRDGQDLHSGGGGQGQGWTSGGHQTDIRWTVSPTCGSGRPPAPGRGLPPPPAGLLASSQHNKQPGRPPCSGNHTHSRS